MTRQLLRAIARGVRPIPPALFLLAAVLLAFSPGVSGAAPPAAQNRQTTGDAAYPGKPVRIVVPQTPGSSADFFARTIGERLNERWSVPVVIENRPGAGGNIAMETVAKATPDGHTLTVTTEGTLAISPHLYRKLPYDTFRDFAPITRLAVAPYVLIVTPAVPATSVRDLVQLARSKPGTINFASGGNGTGTHLSGELFKVLAGINIVHVPYKGATPALIDVVGGQVQMMFVGVPTALSQIKAGRLKALGVTTRKRSPVLPEVPTVAEGGLAGYEVEPWWGVLVPVATPGAVISKLHADVVNEVKTPVYKERLALQGAEPITDTPPQFRSVIKAEFDKWGKVIKDAGVRIE